MKSMRVVVDLSVADDANDMEVADVVFEVLVNSEAVEDFKAIESVDGANPERQ